MEVLTLAEKKKRLDKLAENFNKQKGKTVVGRISENEELKSKIVVTFIETPSINVNNAFGGGWPRGRISIAAGNEDSGKTYELLETIAKNQKKDPNFTAGWLESERSISQRDLDLFGIDGTRFYYYEVDREGAAEEALDLTESILLTGGVDMYVINSLKCLVPKEELEASISKQQIGLQARMNAKMMRKLTAIVADQNVAFIMVQHLMTDIGTMYGDPLTISGGRAIRYGASLIADFRKLSIQAGDPISKEEGVKIGITVRKNHVVTDKFPYIKTEYYGLFGVGTEQYLELTQLAIADGILVKGGAFIKVPDENGDPKIDPETGEKMQWQGVAKFRQYCIDNPKFYEDLRNKVSGKTISESLSEEEIKDIEAEEEKLLNDPDLNFKDDDIITKANNKKKK
jgi:recombination protein RecA